MANNITSHNAAYQENTSPLLSVVVPVYNEEKNIGPVVNELLEALKGHEPHEILLVNDGSTDNSQEVLMELTNIVANFRTIQHRRKRGQSAAVYSGVLAARAPIVATLDGDGQNDPADIPRLFEVYKSHAKNDGRLMVTGWRKERSDHWYKRFSSRVANIVRSFILADKTPDTGCGLKIFRREDFLRLPIFDHMHRFMPALMIQSGGRVMSAKVNHRPRQSGNSKYGTFDRLLVGLTDILGVIWLGRRRISVEVLEDAETSNTDQIN